MYQYVKKYCVLDHFELHLYVGIIIIMCQHLIFSCLTVISFCHRSIAIYSLLDSIVIRNQVGSKEYQNVDLKM